MSGINPIPGCVPSFVELILLRLLDGGRLGYRTLIGPLTTDTPPDAVALALGGTAALGAATVCHSTSWRWDHGAIVLTYVMTPDPSPQQPAVLLDAPSIVTSGDALRPSPSVLHGPHVAAHAVRHLSFLAGTDRTTRDAASARPSLWLAIDVAARTMPVGQHNEVHDAAEKLASRSPVIDRQPA